MTRVTSDNIDALRDSMAVDQAGELAVGCKTWPIHVDGQRGQMTVWPNGRAAVALGADSIWGEWEDGRLIADSGDGAWFDASGNFFEEGE